MKTDFAYRFVTTWKLEADIHSVWKLIYDQDDWPNWWKGVLKVSTIREGDEHRIGKIMRYTWKSLLPYSLAFDMVAEIIEPPHLLAGTAFGELDGKGRWEISQEENVTTVRYYWYVNTTRPWMNRLSWLLKPAFKWNHDIVMNWGAQGLAKKLGARLLASENHFDTTGDRFLEARE